jgi:flagellar hook-associated protein 3 FlgL
MRTLAMDGASGFEEDENREVMAVEVEKVRDQLLSLANTSQGGRYLFGGTETLTVPFDSAGLYAGNDDEVRAAIDSDMTVGVTVSGGRAFQAGGDIFTTLTDLADALRNDDTAAMQTLIVDLKAEMDNVSEVRGETGARLELIDRTLNGIADEQLHLQTRIVELEDIDLEEVAVQLASADSSFQSLSVAGARVLGRSLFDYLG